MPKQHHRKPSRQTQFLAIGGVALLVLAVFVFKEKAQTAVPIANSTEPAEVQFDRALADRQLILAFFHSNNCRQCLIMIDTVSQVYPDFSTSVALVDVNVYDDNNSKLLKRVGLQFIPTLIFYDHEGKEKVSVGVMEAEQLRQTLVALVEGD